MGYNHSAFSFAVESGIVSKEISKKDCPPGALVTHIQKGLLMTQLESSVDAALHSEHSSFQWEVMKFKRGLDEKLVEIKERSLSARKTKIFSLSETNDYQQIFLSNQTSFIMKSHNVSLSSIKFSSNSSCLAVGGVDGILVVWEVFPFLYDSPSTFSFQKDAVISLSWSESGLLAVGLNSGAVFILNPLSSDQKIRYENRDNLCPVVVLEFKGEKLLVGNHDGNVRIIDNNSVIQNYQLFSELSDVRWTKSFPVASAGKSVFALQDEPKVIATTRKNIIQMAVDPRKEMVAASDSAGFVAFVETDTGRSSCQQVHSQSTTGITWSTNSRLYLTSDIDGEIKITDIQEPHPSVSKGHCGPIVGLAFDPRGRYYVSVGVDRLINCWLSRTNHQEFCFESYEDVLVIDWSSDGRFLAFGMRDGSVALLDFQLFC